jgi:hypothetical protein
VVKKHIIHYYYAVLCNHGVDALLETVREAELKATTSIEYASTPCKSIAFRLKLSVLCLLAQLSMALYPQEINHMCAQGED